MKRNSRLLLFFVFLMPELVRACTCGGIASPCEAYANASAVFIGYVRRVEPASPQKSENGNEYYGEQLAYVQIEKSFKGSKQLEIVLHQPGDNCTPKFKVGDRWLVYANYDRKNKIWAVYGCGRSGALSQVNDDLMYLYGLPVSSTKTRLSGEIKLYANDPVEGFKGIRTIAGAKVKITGPNKSYQIYTDTNGIYQITGLPPGTYLIEPEIPPGLKLRFPMAFGDSPDVEKTSSGEQREEREEQVAVKLTERSCAGSDFVLISDSSISGKVFDGEGKPLAGVCLDLRFADGSDIGYMRTFDCTDKQGNYKLEEMPPGQYVIGVNLENGPDGRSPYPPTYYPGVLEKEKATVIIIGEGTKLNDYDVNIPKRLATRTIEGRVIFSNGLQVTKEREPYVTLNEAEGDALNSGYAAGPTDERGFFSLPILREQSGWLHATARIEVKDIPKCQATRQLLAGKEDYQTISFESKPIKIEPSDENVQGIKIVIPIPSCAEDRSKQQ